MLLVEMFSYFSWHVRFAGFPEKQHDDTEYMRERRKYSKWTQQRKSVIETDSCNQVEMAVKDMKENLSGPYG